MQPRMGKAAVEQRGVDDLVLMPKITEQDICANLEKRYFNDLIYTNIGPVLISVNPFRRIDALLTDECLHSYRGRYQHEQPPHVYALAEAAYRGVKSENINQCVIISGESGAGKTEASKLVMQYVAAVSGNSGGVDFVKHVILESNPLLEAFGNAKTLRNNNSSRFGKYFEIHFNRLGEPCGGRITNYLLEKSRVTFQTKGERSFHIFYQLLAGASDAEAQEMQLYEPHNYNYLNQSACYTVDGIDDIKEFADTRNAMNVMGMTADEQRNMFHLVAGILHLGNVAFYDGGKGTATVHDENYLNLAASYLRVEPFALKNALLFRVLNTGGAGAKKMSTYNVPQNVEQAASARDALAKTIYSRMFDWIVSKVNEALQKQGGSGDHNNNMIGVLDIFGFEIFEQNGFEQFCINYVNEKLQQYFIELTLKAEQEEYVNEGIQWTPIKYFNNKVVCELIEGKRPPGIFSLLDDICFTMHAQSDGMDSKFLQKCQGGFPSHLHFRGMNNAFSIKHYAGEVTYEAEGFCEKNKDTLFDDLIAVIQESENRLLVSWFPEDTKQLQKKRPTTAGFKLKTSCDALMDALSRCSPHYIRCIKPNDNKAYHDWDATRTKHQVQYLGLLENVRVRRAGFAYRAEFDRFLRRYKKLSAKTWGIWGEWSGAPRDGCQTLLNDLGLDTSQWQLGKSKVFIRYPETLFHLEECLDRKDYDCTLRIQKAWRNWKSRKHQLEQRKMAADLLKGKKERQRHSVNRKYEFDYINYDANYPLQDCVRSSGRDKEATAFTDQVLVLNRRGKPERRDLIVTDQAVYFAMRKKKSGQVVYNLKRRIPLGEIASLSLSTLQDNYVVIHHNQYDMVFENDKKTEIVTILMENYKLSGGRDLPVNFNDNITFKASNGAQRRLTFSKNESASAQPSIKKSRANIQIGIATGLPKETAAAEAAVLAVEGAAVEEAAAVLAAAVAAVTPSLPLSLSPSLTYLKQRLLLLQDVVALAWVVPELVGEALAWVVAALVVLPRVVAVLEVPELAVAVPVWAVLVDQVQAVAVPEVPELAVVVPVWAVPPVLAAAVLVAPVQAVVVLVAPVLAEAVLAWVALALVVVDLPVLVAVVKALYDYDAQTGDELTFKEGDTIIIHQKDPGGWWEGELNGKRGWVPANYVQDI